MEELNRKIDRNIWMTMPNSYLYQRQIIENDREKRLKDERMAEYKKKAEEAAKKQRDKEGKKSEPVKEVKKDEKEVEKAKKEKAEKEKAEKAENPPIDPKYKEKLLKIPITMLDDPKSVDIMF